MISKALPRLLELRKLRSSRQQNVLRVQQLALDQAVAAAEHALTNLHTWQQDRHRLESAMYDGLIGETVALSDLLAAKAAITSLHDHEQLLERRVEEAVEEADEAEQAREEAYTIARELHRQVEKCECLLQAFQHGV